jgi:Protein of unknown function (DUF5672)
MKKLDKVTLVIVDCSNYGNAMNSLMQSLQEIQPAKTKFFTDIDLPEINGIEVVKINPIRSKEQYSQWVMKELYKHIDTEFILTTQWDGYVLNGDCWDDEFYKYDFIGAPWLYESGRNIGNGGFCLKSKRLCNILGTDPLIQVLHPEDQSIGILYRGYLEETYGIKFPSEELAEKFSYELRTPTQKTFGFHGFFHQKYKPYICIKRMAAMGDVVRVEPVLEYYHSKGYNVILDTLPQFQNLFAQHYFKVYQPGEVDGRIEYPTINLDMSYETTYWQPHLKSYFEFCGIKDYKLRNAKLNLNVPRETRFFDRNYVIIHNEVRAQAARNIQGNINWEEIVTLLNSKGFDVVQIGSGGHEKIKGAIHFTCPNEYILMTVIRTASLFIGIDSGPSNIAVGFDVPAIIFFGSVDPNIIHVDLTNIYPIQLENVCSKPKCWHSQISTIGVECVEIGKKQITFHQGIECPIEIKNPPCVQFKHEQLVNAINTVLNNG